MTWSARRCARPASEPAGLNARTRELPRRALGYLKDFMTSARISNIARAVAALALLGTLAGCDTLSDWLASDKVDYKSAKSAPSKVSSLTSATMR